MSEATSDRSAVSSPTVKAVSETSDVPMPKVSDTVLPDDYAC